MSGFVPFKDAVDEAKNGKYAIAAVFGAVDMFGGFIEKGIGKAIGKGQVKATLKESAEVGVKAAVKEFDEVAVKMAESATAKTGTEGGLNLFKFGKPTTTTTEGWKAGDRMLKMFDKGSPKLNWKQNAGFLRREMREGNPIFDSYRYFNGQQIPTGGFLNAERKLLESRSWKYDPSTGAYHSPL